MGYLLRVRATQKPIEQHCGRLPKIRLTGQIQLRTCNTAELRALVCAAIHWASVDFPEPELPRIATRMTRPSYGTAGGTIRWID